MNLIKKLLLNKKERNQEEVLKYLHECLGKATYQDKSMKSYFDKGYRANCYYYSTFLVLCLKPTDRLVRGNIHIKRGYETVDLCKDKKTYPNYKHGWVEFEYNGEWFVYDDHYYYPIPIKLWHEVVSPYEIDAKFTQTELIEYVYHNYKEKFNIKEQEDKKIVSTEYIWDEKFCIPFMYLDLVMKDNRITKVDIDKDDVYTQYVKRAPIIDWA